MVSNTINGSITLSHILFTNDTLIFCDVDHDQIQALRVMLLCFEVVSGIKVNLGESKLVLVGVVHNINSLASLLGSKLAYLPLKYLDLPRGRLTIWDEVVEKVEKILTV